MTVNNIPITLRHSPIFKKNWEAIKRKRFIINRGGTRSSKTHSILQMWEYLCATRKGLKILIARKELPDLRNTALKDFQDYLENIDRYSGKQLFDKYDNFPSVDDSKESKAIGDFWSFHKTDRIYTHKITGSEIHFNAFSDPQKARGAKYDYIQLTEGNEMDYDVFRQLNIRAKYCIVIDFNPSDEDTWINRHLEQGRPEKCEVIQSSYLDNPFLHQDNIDEIEDLKRSDPDYFHVFGEGNYGTVQGKIFDYKTITFEEFKNLQGYDEYLGLDFGWRNPSCLMHIKDDGEGNVYGHEVFNAARLREEDMHEIMIDYGLILNHHPIYCDPNNPSAIELLESFGWNCHYANKKVSDGIRFMQGKGIYLTTESSASKNQFNTYVFKKDRNGNYFDEPVKFNDHACDSFRYAVYTHTSPYIN